MFQDLSNKVKKFEKYLRNFCNEKWYGQSWRIVKTCYSEHFAHIRDGKNKKWEKFLLMTPLHFLYLLHNAFCLKLLIITLLDFLLQNDDCSNIEQNMIVSHLIAWFSKWTVHLHSSRKSVLFTKGRTTKWSNLLLSGEFECLSRTEFLVG